MCVAVLYELLAPAARHSTKVHAEVLRLLDRALLVLQKVHGLYDGTQEVRNKDGTTSYPKSYVFDDMIKARLIY